MNTILFDDPRTDAGLVITRTISAPQAAVFAAWTNADYLQQWWGPVGFTNPVCQIDPMPGGKIYIEMCAPDGTIYPMSGEVAKVDAPSQFVFKSAALNEKRQPTFEGITTVSFVACEEGTELRLHAKIQAIHAPEVAEHCIEGMPAGWSQSLDRLAELVAGAQ